MPEFRKLHRQIEEAFSAEPEKNEISRLNTWQNAWKTTPPNAAILSFFAAILFASLGIFSQSRDQMAAAGILTLCASLLLAISLIETIRRGQKTGHMHAQIQELQDALERAKYENAKKTRLLATVSHDIRTPLSGISGMSRLLSETRLTAEQTNYLTGIRQSSEALSQLVDDLLDFVSIDAGRFQLRPQEVNIRQLIENVTEMLAHRAHEKGIEIASTIGSEVPAFLTFDPARLRQVLFNIIGNAVKFTYQGGVLIAVRLERGKLSISVRDSGPGMNENDLSRVFHEFEQAGNDRDKAAGTGLGLAISKRIIGQCGGALSVESTVGEGSTFTIRLPVQQPDEYGARHARSKALRPCRVIALIPDGVTCEALEATVQTLGGLYQHAATVEEARQLLIANRESHNTVTDVIADHRLADDLTRLLAEEPELVQRGTRRIYLVNPEARTQSAFGIGFDSWLIRPLREQSLTGVLLGRMTGIELRDPPVTAATTSNSRFTLASPSSLRILLGEDDPVNRLLLRTVLTKSGHDVTETDDFSHLVSIACDLSRRPDAIVTDLAMPGGNGIDAISAIRGFERDHNLHPVPIIVVTASKVETTRQSVLEAGASHLLSKPADPDILKQLIAPLAMRNAS